MGATFEDSKKYNLSKPELIQNAKEAIEISKFETEQIDEENGIIYAKSKLNIWSWSEKIVIRIEKDGNVTIKSECYLSTQIFDWGKNKRNVKTLFEHME
ncbi:hypothetical protein [uncultured Aquimarina sp.]|uniref:hypothetical protein n=1 Tax=uncultured Aquimarina sp. TaxID=575652 RepID=UPI002637983F|nr:hypothetical protein [uncultured Aquimarina sp.]